MPDPTPTSSSSILIQLAIVCALVLLNGFFVASEFALVAVRRTRMDQLAEAGNNTAKMVAAVTGNLDRYIAATQVGITIASLLLGGIGEHILEPLIGNGLRAAFVPAEFLGITRAAVAFVLAYFLMTTMHVVVGELIPKSIALQSTEATALFIVRPMVLAAKIFTPLVWLLNGLGGLLLRVIGMHKLDENSQVHSPEELDLIFTQSFQGGELTGTELELLHRAVRFSDLCAREVMVPRVEIGALPVEISLEDLKKYLYADPHNRIPVYQNSLDSVIGIAHLKDLVRLEASLRNETHNDEKVLSLRELMRPVLTVPETLTIDKLLGKFKNQHQQLAIVIDEFGGTSGLVTMGDFLTQVFGDVPDEFDTSEPEIAENEDGSVSFSGRVRIETINEKFGTGFSDEVADTMAGLVLDNLGRTAQIDDEVRINQALLKVTGLERLRITRLQMQLPPKEDEESSSD
jgi:CBS domain containing-hemolysin-like protein